MKRQEAFINQNTMLKGGLHCHTTRSDGVGTPEEVIRLHKENNFDFLALTDHRIYNYKNFAEDVDITIIPGMEFDNTIDRTNGFRTFHEVYIGPDDETNGYAQDEELPRGEEPNQEAFQRLLDDAHSKNNLTFYCHPQWSSTPTRYFDKLKGNFAIEVWNSGCAIENDMDTDNGSYWDELLGMGQRLFGVATDDGHAMYQHCKGWVMVNAENNVKAILKALKNGAFYSSCGPVIKDFYVDDENIAHVEVSECERILFQCDKHPSKSFNAKDEPLVSAQLDLKDSYQYIRVTVEDKEGRKAWTNPIFLK
ncbi:MAG: CehA/McbA family metallohydrolase [Clostridia bacterium]|nr:CehA/McbA family metallohydrolase [Clostridia bacterium]